MTSCAVREIQKCGAEGTLAGFWLMLDFTALPVQRLGMREKMMMMVRRDEEEEVKGTADTG